MNVRKRGLALLMCICMIFTLLPFSALADATTQDVVYGTYGDDGKWYEYSGWNEKSDQWRSVRYAELDRSSTDGTSVHLQNDGCNDVW